MTDDGFATPRLALRPLVPEDLDAIAALHADPEVMAFLGDGRPVPRETVAARDLPGLLRRHPELAGDPGAWAAESRATGRFLGWFALRPAEAGSTSVLTLGYRLRRDAWGYGYATEGTRALVRRAFTEHGAERVVADTMAVNTASRRVMEKAGLHHVRTVHLDWPVPIPGNEHGDVEYELSRADWPTA